MKQSLSTVRLDEFELRRTHGVEFWAGQKSWPIDTDKYVFLGRALDLCGAKEFPDVWSGLEPTERFLPDFDEPEIIGEASYALDHGWGPDYLKTLLQGADPDGSYPLPLSGEHIALGLDIYKRDIAPNRRASASRLENLIKKMIRAFADGSLLGFSQTIGGGAPFLSIDPISWTSDEARQWFNFCYMGAHGVAPEFLKAGKDLDKVPPAIFVERQSLETFLSINPNAEAGWSDRSEILASVRRGEMSHEEAELRARAEGIEPFSKRPSLDDFDPFRQATWTFEMTIAWIIWRDADHVREFWADYQNEVWEWSEALEVIEVDGRKRWSKGMRLDQGKVSGFLLQFAATFQDGNGAKDGRPLNDFRSAWDDLASKLTDAKLVGAARIAQSEKLFELRADEWSNILIPLSRPEDGGTIEFKTKETKVELFDICFPSKDVIALWPATLLSVQKEILDAQNNAPEVVLEEHSPAARHASLDQVRQIVRAAHRFLLAKGYLHWTRDEAQKESRLLIGATRSQMKRIFADPEFAAIFPIVQGPRGPKKGNRKSELVEFRHFFQAANMRK